jgi:uncharacterized protein
MQGGSQQTAVVQRFSDPLAFRARSEPFLLLHEAAHNLLLGVIAALARGSVDARFSDPPYLATLEAGTDVVGVALRTPPFNLVLSEMPREVLALLAADVRGVVPPIPGVLGPRVLSLAFAEEWQRSRGMHFRIGRRQRIYQLDAVTPVQDVAGWLRPARAADRDVLIEWVDAFMAETAGGGDREYAERTVDGFLLADDRECVLWEDGGPVSMAAVVGPTPHGIRVSYVFTPAALRGRGYASACVAALSQKMLDAGRRFCFLFTDLDNPTSNHIYQNIGYRPVVDLDEYVFEREAAWS